MASTDRDVLLVLYRSTDGPNWKDSTNWDTDAPLADWHGVVVNGPGRVVELCLISNNLRGQIPWELGNLTALQFLRLEENRLHGPIPPHLGNLVAMTFLNLRWNQLIGHIPPELGKLTALEFLSLEENQLDGFIPPELGNLTELTSLWLSGNSLTGPIPLQLGKLSAMTTLNLRGNQLTGPIPPELGKLAALKFLFVQDNALTGGPRHEESLSEWKSRLQDELAEQEKRRLQAMQQIRDALIALYRSTDGPNWKNSTNWGSNAHLSEWYGVEANAHGCAVKLCLDANNLRGHIPKELGTLMELTWLVLSNNELTGPIPKELGALSNLEDAWLHNNNLTGFIPPELGKLAALKHLYLHENRLTGPIPKELGALSNLKRIWLQVNHLIGPIPPELGNLSALTSLNIRENELTGGPAENESLSEWKTRLRVKQEQAKLDHAKQSRIHDDYPRVTAPTDRDALLALYRSTDGSNWKNSPNWGSGPHLSQWHGVKVNHQGRVVKLFLDTNNLRGHIPKELGVLSELTWLALGDNELTGPRPPPSALPTAHRPEIRSPPKWLG
eukprot:g20224.t1